MDPNWVDKLTNNFKDKICEICNIWIEMGIVNEKFISRSNALQNHVESLLNEMLEEENRHKEDVIKSIESISKDIAKISVELHIERNYDVIGALVNKETSLLKIYKELESIKASRVRRFHYFLDLEDKLCERLFEYKLNLNGNLIPTEEQLSTYERKINELENLKVTRAKEFLLKRKEVLYYFNVLEENSSNDCFIQSVCNDEDASCVPLSKDFLCQCDCLINRLKSDYQKNMDECRKMREQYEKLTRLLYPGSVVPTNDKIVSLSSNCYSYPVLKSLKYKVQQLELEKLAKLPEFAEYYQTKIREKMRNNFSSHLEKNDRYIYLFNMEKVDEYFLTELENELERWISIEVSLEPLKTTLARMDDLFDRLTKINISLKDPVTLKNRGGILLKIEKEKKEVKKELPKCESKVREVLSSLDQAKINPEDLYIDNLSIDDYITYMWNQVESEKENERKDKKLNPANSKLDVSKSSYTKPLQVSQQKPTVQKSFSKITKPSEFKKPEILRPLSKIPQKKKALSPIAKSKPMMKNNLDRRFSKSVNSLFDKSENQTQTGSSRNLYDLFCKSVQGHAVTSSFMEH